MKYEKKMKLPNGKELLLRNAAEDDAQIMLEIFHQAHEETDFLLTYCDESTHNLEEEAKFLKGKAESDCEVEIFAIVDGKIVGTAGIGAYGSKYKVKHRADFGISILKDYWGMGVGTRLTEACIDCAKQAGFEQIELQVVADNERAIRTYSKLGFVEYGRNPKGFKSRFTGYQELIYMRLEILENCSLPGGIR